MKVTLNVNQNSPYAKHNGRSFDVIREYKSGKLAYSLNIDGTEVDFLEYEVLKSEADYSEIPDSLVDSILSKQVDLIVMKSQKVTKHKIMKLTKKELQDLTNTGTCEVIRTKKVSKKEIDFCFDNFSSGKIFTINGLNVIIGQLYANPFLYENKGYKCILKAI